MTIECFLGCAKSAVLIMITLMTHATNWVVQSQDCTQCSQGNAQDLFSCERVGSEPENKYQGYILHLARVCQRSNVLAAAPSRVHSTLS